MWHQTVQQKRCSINMINYNAFNVTNMNMKKQVSEIMTIMGIKPSLLTMMQLPKEKTFPMYLPKKQAHFQR